MADENLHEGQEHAAEDMSLGAAAKPAKSKPAKPAKADWPKFLKSSTRFGYTDPETNLHYAPHAPVRVEAEPAEGCWLHCQMAAGLIVEA